MELAKIIKPLQRTNKCKHCNLANICIPAGLDKKTLHRVHQLRFKARLLRPGDYLCRQGELLDSLFAIRTGILKSYLTQENGREYVMGFRLPGDLFGFEGIDPQQKSSSIIALDYTNVCEISMKQIEEIVQHAPQLGPQLLKLVSQRIRHDNMALLRTSAEQRVASFILQLCAQHKKLGHSKPVCDLLMTHQDIANYLRITPETISRTFRSLQAKKIIKVTRKAIHLKDIQQLRSVAEQPEMASA